MSIIAVDTEQLNAQSVRMRGTMSRITSDVSSMRAGLQELQNTWRGGAAANFQSLVVEWSQTQARVEASLAAINTALDAASATYRDTEMANMSRFAR